MYNKHFTQAIERNWGISKSPREERRQVEDGDRFDMRGDMWCNGIDGKDGFTSANMTL